MHHQAGRRETRMQHINHPLFEGVSGPPRAAATCYMVTRMQRGFYETEMGRGGGQ